MQCIRSQMRTSFIRVTKHAGGPVDEHRYNNFPPIPLPLSNKSDIRWLNA
ncbi:hypothetical protein [Nibrella saemangeumensis]